jgi:hypothetical protein
MQLNKDNTRLVAGAGSVTKRLREVRGHADQLQSALNRALSDQARAETEHDALQAAAIFHTERHTHH